LQATRLGRGVRKLRELLELIKFQHTVFAMPFALISALVCVRGLPPWRDLFWIVVAMVGARSSAMGFNRIVDRELDALNPRTKERELVTGKVAVTEAWALVVGASVLFIFAAWMLNRLCFWLSFVALAIILGYSYSKRFTSLSHIWLGLCLSIAPVGAWIALTGRFALAPMVLALAVVLWVAGFDIIYATLDEQFDREVGLYSAVIRLGINQALRLSAALHAGFIAALVAFGILTRMGVIYLLGVVVAGGLIAYEHSIVRPGDPRRVNAAFFTVNALVSIGLLVVVAVDIFLTG